MRNLTQERDDLQGQLKEGEAELAQAEQQLESATSGTQELASTYVLEHMS